MNKNFYVCLNGKLVKARDAKVSVFDHGFLYGDGVYDTLRAYGDRVWQVEKHLDRIEKSAKRLQLKLPFSKKKIAGFIEELVKRNKFKEARIRITITRGINNYDFSGCETPTLLIHAVPIKREPKTVYQNGVTAVTVRYERMAPEAKTTSLLPMVLAQQEMKKKGAYEAIFVDSTGLVREGTITNVFIIKSGVLITPRTKILRGTTRTVVLKLARKAGLKTKVIDFKKRRLYAADEIFITNTTRKIIPIKKVDGKKIGTGRPGSYTKKLMKIFDDYTKEKIG